MFVNAGQQYILKFHLIKFHFEEIPFAQKVHPANKLFYFVWINEIVLICFNIFKRRKL